MIQISEIDYDKLQRKAQALDYIAKSEQHLRDRVAGADVTDVLKAVGDFLKATKGYLGAVESAEQATPVTPVTPAASSFDADSRRG